MRQWAMGRGYAIALPSVRAGGKWKPFTVSRPAITAFGPLGAMSAIAAIIANVIAINVLAAIATSGPMIALVAPAVAIAAIVLRDTVGAIAHRIALAENGAVFHGVADCHCDNPEADRKPRATIPRTHYHILPPAHSRPVAFHWSE